jgi:CRISPR-associated endonuclease/helicase Cas3
MDVDAHPGYDTDDATFSRLMRCWGKSGVTPDQFHPVLYHMLDVGHVAQQLLDEKASPRWRRALGNVWDVPPDTLRHWLPWLAALHDIGKISAAFQGKSESQRQRLEQEGFCFSGRLGDPNVLHTHIGQAFVGQARRDLFPIHNLDERVGRICACAIGGHHGRYLKAYDLQMVRGALISEPSEWDVLRRQAVAWLYQRLVADSDSVPDASPRHTTAAALLLTGFTILCDWLASDARHFPLSPDMSLEAYCVHSRQRAWEVVHEAGFLQHTLSLAIPRFKALFPAYVPPRPLQAAVDQVPETLLRKPCLAIIEAPTGEGKTEAAWALAHRIACATGQTDEMYYALPTMATSNQMFARMQRYLREHLRLPTSIKLVHGQAHLIEDDLRIEPTDEGDSVDQRALLEWFAPLKRSLLAPFGVGTVDQAELAALNVRHGMLRLIGLAGKVVIFDEVHAYDIYMTCVVERLLSWLSVLGSSVILLSATLPLQRRNQLARAYGCTLHPLEALGDAYPILYVGNQDAGYATPIAAAQPERRIAVEWLHLGDQDAEAKAHRLLQLVAEGGCACWITNTVARAQQLFRALTAMAPANVSCALLHAQYPLEERHQREQEIVRQYGREGERPQRGIVVGTQVLEQSLDLDFDVMISDLAPVDLILQRAGRLHRHVRPRPPAHPWPKLYLNAPLQTPDDPDLKTDQHIYAPYYLLRTWQLLRTRRSIILPQDYRTLVEAVYGDTAPSPEDVRLAEAWRELQTKEQLAISEAETRLLLSPENSEDLLCSQMASVALFEEDEGGTAWIVARTRMGEESITVIPLELDAPDLASAKRARVSDQEEWLSLADPAPREIQLRLLRRSVRVSRQDAVRALRNTRTSLPPLFRESPLLRSGCLLGLHRGCARVDALTFRLDPDLGLVIERT